MDGLKVETKSGGLEEKVSEILQEIRVGASDWEIIRLTRDILTKRIDGFLVAPGDNYAEAKVIFDWVKSNIRFTGDPVNLDLIQNAKATLELKTGDCVANTILLGSMLGSIGIPVAIKLIGRYKPEYDHVYILAGFPVHAPEDWIPFDVTEPRPGVQPKSLIEPLTYRVF